MTLSRQISNLTKQKMGGVHLPFHYSFFARVVYMVLVLTALMAVTICTYQGTENLIGWVSQLGI